MANKKKLQYINAYTKNNYKQVCGRLRVDSKSDMEVYNFIKDYGVIDFMRDGATVLKQLQAQKGVR